jgi:metal-responsive CopG/Arc/MetJ family transcriptional regulator
LGVSITKDFYNEIERKANLWQISKSELTRIALREYLNRS